jgi:uncharacterized protein GlcG (DUF336 family)
MSAITLEQADTIIQKAIDKRKELGLAPLTVAILDPGGHLVAFKREDNSSLLRPQIAQGKAWGCLGMGISSRKIVDRFAANSAFFTSLSTLCEGQMLASPGGLLIRDQAGDIVGAVGISGDTGENDEKCAIAGIEAAGLTYDP